MKRLVTANNELFESLSNKCNKILEDLSDLKYLIYQSRQYIDDKTLNDKIEQNENFIDKASEVILAVNFNLSNIEDVPLYDTEQLTFYDEQVNEDAGEETDMSGDDEFSMGNEPGSEEDFAKEDEFANEPEESDETFDIDEDFSPDEEEPSGESEEDTGEELEFNFEEEGE